MRLWIFVIIMTQARGAEIPSKYPRTVADVSSINNLATQKPSSLSLDPKIRKALLNVLNRLELQDYYQAEAELAAQKITAPLSPPQTDAAAETTTDDSDFIKWAYKTNGTFKEYYNNVTASTVVNQAIKIDPVSDEPGALFFQVPNTRSSPDLPLPAPDDDRRESLYSQETKNDALSNAADLVLDDFPEPEEGRPQSSLQPSNSSTEKTQIVREKDVEVFQAPLLTAFTLEQDEQGLPRRIIPLEPTTSDLRSIFNDRLTGRRANDPTSIPTFRFASDPLFPPSLTAQDEHKRIRLEIESQYRELLRRKHEIELEKRRIIAEQEQARRLRFDLEQRQRQQAINQNEILRSEIAFQKSIEPQFSFNSIFSGPQVKSSAAQFFPEVVDRQLQNLFHRSGLGREEDLNIVTKILSLNHEGDGEGKAKNTHRAINDWRRDLRQLDAKRIVRREVSCL